MKPLTRIAIVLDKSGSMGNDHQNPNRTKETVEGYNRQIREIVANGQNQDIKVSLFTFNGQVYEHLIDVDAKEMQEATIESYVPNGMTAWYDGLGYAIEKLQDLGKENPECSYLVITISDGQENSSHHYNANKLKSKIEECKATGMWTFTFMGCSDSDIKEFRETSGATNTSGLQWSNKNAGDTEKAMRYASAKLGDYLEKRCSGVTQDEDYFMPVGPQGPMGPQGPQGVPGNRGDYGASVTMDCCAVDIQLANYQDAKSLDSVDSTFSKGNVANWTR